MSASNVVNSCTVAQKMNGQSVSVVLVPYLAPAEWRARGHSHCYSDDRQTKPNTTRPTRDGLIFLNAAHTRPPLSLFSTSNTSLPPRGIISSSYPRQAVHVSTLIGKHRAYTQSTNILNCSINPDHTPHAFLRTSSNPPDGRDYPRTLNGADYMSFTSTPLGQGRRLDHHAFLRKTASTNAAVYGSSSTQGHATAVSQRPRSRHNTTSNPVSYSYGYVPHHVFLSIIPLLISH